MSLSSVELWQRISAAGLAAPMICRSWAAEALQGLQPSDAADAIKILEQLVRIGRLTEYQADLIAGRRQGDFKKGVWTLLRPVPVALWDGWFEATKSPNEPPTWLRWITTDDLAKLQSAAPSLPRGLRLAQIKGPNLQGVQIPELIDKQLQLQVQPIRGIPLTVALEKDSQIGLKSASIIRQIAEALKPLHAVGLAHGRVLPDRVYWNASVDTEKSITLARDPICSLTASLDTQSIGTIQNGLNGLTPAQFMAPEFLAPGQLPTPSSDIYSLGCLWWWLVTGKPLVAGSTLDKQLARQAEASIALPKDCSLPPPYVRCLQHCLAKNLPARFATAQQLCQALDAAAVSFAKGPVAKKRPESKPAATVPATAAVKQAVAPKLEKAPESKLAEQKLPEPSLPAAQAAVQTATQPATQPAKQPAVQVVAAEAVAAKTATTTATSNPQPAAETARKNVASDNTQLSAKSISEPAGKLAPKPVGQTSKHLVKAAVVEAEARPEENIKTSDVVSPIAAAATTSPVGSSATQQPSSTEPEPISAVTTSPKVAKPTSDKSVSNKARSATPAGIKAPVRKKVKRKPTNKWALPVIGGLGALCALLGILIASGVMKPSGRKTLVKPTEVASDGNIAVDSTDSKSTSASTSTREQAQDPRLDVYRIVQTGKDLLWAPPSVPKPIALDLLPPGGQIFITLRPKQLMSSTTGKSVLSAYNEDVGPYLEQIGKRSGVAFDSMERVTIAFYAENEVPMTCMRVELSKPLALSELKAGWGSVSNEKADTLTLLTNAGGESYFVAQQPLSDAQSVSEFSFGPTELMKEAAELQGAAGPLVSQLGKLWQVSDADSDFSLLLTSSFLFSEGKSLLANMPKRLASRLREVLEVDSRAALVQTRFEPSWYVEVQLVGLSEREAPRLSELLRQRISGAPTAIEDWFVSEQPHPYWRSLAIRYPQMLRTLAEQSRFGVEAGAAVANAYLPSEAATNILLSTWIASQEGATLAGDAPAETVTATPAAKPLTIEEYLSRKIKLSFDQEPIETALRLVGEEANANLPPGTPQLRFALDGGAFERAGITRNQQLKEFKHVDLPMRDALTAIAKRGNPVPTVKDTREEDQRLIWVVRDDPENAGRQMISLTTRVEATSKNIPLPIEFAPAK